MKCMCAQTRPRFILSSERVLGGMEFEPMFLLFFLRSPAISLGFTTLGEIFAYVTIF